MGRTVYHNDDDDDDDNDDNDDDRSGFSEDKEDSYFLSRQQTCRERRDTRDLEERSGKSEFINSNSVILNHACMFNRNHCVSLNETGSHGTNI